MIIYRRLFHTKYSNILSKQTPQNLKGKSKSSQEWLKRQLSDPYVEKAKMMNLRCRSAFKLLEIDNRYKILKPGDIVLDCGAAPGSWSQVAVERTNATGAKENKRKGAVLSIDLLHFHALPGATIFSGMDFTTAAAQQALKEVLAGRKVNCVLSDMAPNATGIRMLDQEKIMNLGYAVLRFAVTMSSIGAHLVVKLWANGNVSKFKQDLEKFYEQVNPVKPDSSRSDSAELFLVARKYKGFEKTLITNTNTEKLIRD